MVVPSSRETLLLAPRGICAQASKESITWGIEVGDWRNIPKLMSSKGHYVSRGVGNEGSHPYIVNDSSEVQCFQYGWVSEREIWDPDISEIEASTEKFTGRHSWARGYRVRTVGLDEQMIREYIKNKVVEERRQEQMQLAGL
ncbi:hypothetical protein GL2_31120 [Microbulbifer sp. GL-2]|nr:hypothetical protein [Microbulbifer sp. GL-2]BBM03038.1 hypothetical protein GL2_31120 [Microbulbifer sp. GL-2]